MRKTYMAFVVHFSDGSEVEVLVSRSPYMSGIAAEEDALRTLAEELEYFGGKRYGEDNWVLAMDGKVVYADWYNRGVVVHDAKDMADLFLAYLREEPQVLQYFSKTKDANKPNPLAVEFGYEIN